MSMENGAEGGWKGGGLHVEDGLWRVAAHAQEGRCRGLYFERKAVQTKAGPLTRDSALNTEGGGAKGGGGAGHLGGGGGKGRGS
jgi:hypothetical protein